MNPRYDSKRIGSHSLMKKIKEIRPKYVVFGHNHGQPGIVEEDGITFINATLLDDSYVMVNKPTIIEF
jgi:Icc-related predicted phosphoesterase